MQNKKVTMLAAVLAVTVIAMAGVGYAVTYTATTTNSNNSMAQTYIAMSQTGEGEYATDKFLEDIYFDTVNTAKNVTKYTPVYTHIKTNTAFSEAEANVTAEYAVASTLLSLTIDQENNSQGTIALDVSVNDAFNDNGLEYWMAITSDGQENYTNATEYNNGWSFTDVPLKANNADTVITVQLFVKGTLDEPMTPLTGVEFTFKATAKTTA